MKKLMTIVVSALCAAVAFTSSAEVWNIPAPGGVGDVAALETALTSHATGDEIVLATGTYSLTKTLSNKSEVAVTVRGATGDPKDVVLDGQGQVRCLNLNGKSTSKQSTFFPPNAADRVILKDVTIANGMQRDVTDVNCSPDGKSENMVGAGGVYLRYGFVENCVFTNCQARAETAGLKASGGALFARIAFVTNCTFVACEAYSYNQSAQGGAICGISGGSGETYTPSDLRFLSCRVVNASTADTPSGCGGAAYFPFTGDSGTIVSKLVFVDCVATNTAGWRSSYKPNGGGLYYASDPKLTFTDCVFSNCLAYGEGGGFWTSRSCIVSNCTFVGNCAVNSYGGGLHAHKGVTVENCIFKDNTSSISRGGGISADDGKLMVRHSCFDKNKSLAHSGGAIYAALGVDAEDCVFRSNDAMATSGNNIGGGAICMAANTSEDCLIDRCLFQGNTSPRPSSSSFRGGAAIYLNTSKAGGGVFVRNSVFAGNSGGPVFAVADCETGGETPTWENGAGFYVQNCTITNNIGATQGKTGSRAIFDGATNKASAWQGLFVENCAINGNTDFADGVFFSNFVDNGCLTTQVRNCASDVTTAFPEYGTNGNIAWQKKLKNLGYNSSWITAESTDGGDGTWTEQPVGIYGYYVAANGVNSRCLNEHPAIGAQEPRNFGLILILW